MKTSKNSSHIDTLIITIISCAAAPLLSNWLDIVWGSDNTWKSERLLVLFFSALAGYIIWRKIICVFKKSKLSQKGYDIEHAGIVEQIVWTMPSAMVVMFYDTVFGATAIIILFIIALIILRRDKEIIVFTKYTYITFTGYVVLMILFDHYFSLELNTSDWLITVGVLFVVSIASWIAEEYLSHLFKRKRALSAQDKHKHK